MNKSAMRQELRNRRDVFVNNLTSQDAALAFSAAPSPLKNLFAAEKIVAGYIPVGSEASPLNLTSTARALGCSIALPHVISKLAPMRFLAWEDGDELQSGPFGLHQPHEAKTVLKPDIVLVPLIAFDRQLSRLGQGAGHYDRALSIMDDVVAIGIAWSVQEVDIVPADPWDIPLSAIITEKEWISR